MKKYFNPLKPDSARIVYEILPLQYADPDVEPSPLEMSVEIRDKDSVLVYGPRDLTYQDQKSMVLFWNGKDNQGELVDPEDGPFEGYIALTYRQTGRQESDVVYVPFESKPIIIELVESTPTHRKFVPVRGDDEITLKYRVRANSILPSTVDLSIFDRNGDPEEETSGNYIYNTELQHAGGGEYEAKWDGICTQSSGEPPWFPINEEGHYADPREHPYTARLRAKFEYDAKTEIVFSTDEIYIVPEIVKVIGTHTPFEPDASCDENNPLDLTITCVLKGKIDDTGDESEDMLYYTEDGEVVYIWKGGIDYYEDNDDSCDNPIQRRSYWIEMLDEVELDPESWDRAILGDLEYTWTMTRGPADVMPQEWQSQNTYTAPGTYVYSIRVRNYSEGVDIQIKDSPEEQVKSRPSQIPTGTVENINDCYMVHLKATENDPYSWAQSFLTVPYNDEHPYPVDYHGIDCAGLIHAAEWLNGWEQHKRYADQYVETMPQYSNAIDVMNPTEEVEVERSDWAGIDRKTASGGFDGTWNHIIMIEEYEWRDWHLQGNEIYEKTNGHKYDFIHGYGGDRPPQVVREDNQFFFPIILEPDPQERLWNVWFRRPNRQ